MWILVRGQIQIERIRGRQFTKKKVNLKHRRFVFLLLILYLLSEIPIDWLLQQWTIEPNIATIIRAILNKILLIESKKNKLGDSFQESETRTNILGWSNLGQEKIIKQKFFKCVRAAQPLISQLANPKSPEMLGCTSVEKCSFNHI